VLRAQWCAGEAASGAERVSLASSHQVWLDMVADHANQIAG